MLNFRAFDGLWLLSGNLTYLQININCCVWRLPCPFTKRRISNFRQKQALLGLEVSRERVFENIRTGFSIWEILQEPKVLEDHLKW